MKLLTTKITTGMIQVEPPTLRGGWATHACEWNVWPKPTTSAGHLKGYLQAQQQDISQEWRYNLPYIIYIYIYTKACRYYIYI